MIKLINAFGELIDKSIYVLIGIAFLVFFGGLVKFIFHAGGDEKAIQEGKRLMIWGTVAFFVMLSVWGIVDFFQRAFGLPRNTTLPTPSQDIPNINPFDPRRNG